MDLTTSWRHLFSAVLNLGASEGTIHQRLKDAYLGGLSRICPDPGLPVHLRPQYEELMLELTGFFGTATVGDNRHASRLAKKVVALYDKVVKEL